MEPEVTEQMERSQEDFRELKKNLETLREDLVVLLNTLRQSAKSQMVQAKHRLRASSKNIEDEAQSRLQNAFETLKESGERARARTVETVEQRPIASVLGAFAAGFLMAAIMRRR